MQSDGFTHVPLVYKNLDIYQIRNSILNAIKEVSPLLNGRLLDVGCGKMPYKKYLIENTRIEAYTGLDLEDALPYQPGTRPDIFWDGQTIPLLDASYDCAIATEVLEHCPEPVKTLTEIHRVIKPGGVFFFTVPFLWNLHEVPNDEYRYTPFALDRMLKKSGFTNIEIYATGGWHSSLAQMLGLWVRRSPISPVKRKLFSIFLKPLIRFLIKKDVFKKNIFKEGEMITGIYGWAKK